MVPVYVIITLCICYCVREYRRRRLLEYTSSLRKQPTWRRNATFAAAADGLLTLNGVAYTSTRVDLTNTKVKSNLQGKNADWLWRLPCRDNFTYVLLVKPILNDHKKDNSVYRTSYGHCTIATEKTMPELDIWLRDIIWLTFSFNYHNAQWIWFESVLRHSESYETYKFTTCVLDFTFSVIFNARKNNLWFCCVRSREI